MRQHYPFQTTRGLSGVPPASRLTDSPARPRKPPFRTPAPQCERNGSGAVPGGPGELIRAIAARGCDIEVITLELGRTWTQPSGT